MGNEPHGKPADDELIKCYEKMKFPSGDLDDLIFGKVELKSGEKSAE
jgi:hypothetical protein